MRDELPGRVVIFRGTEPAELDLIEGRLEVEGMRPLRLGRAQPALVGGGNSAFQQLITVPSQFAAAARSILAQAEVQLDEAELERQALASPPPEATAMPGRPRKPRRDVTDDGVEPSFGPWMAPAR